ncbi:DNA-binding response OmpR family regulator [Halarchaeum rubridurum]|uniref:DNA-binding protein n=1 Tax=Halarchaeum rubridurum TaxID=489911 RepID=A0A830FMS7_9EURY|nr:response regulator [Halarchaeum rubridurum]MBP1954605.1 DNA-binding response OmpR family regulator [Halarchaeum rubridurum]GGM62407.1 DNA-binding protein [Halarchaeum rubridurum]
MGEDDTGSVVLVAEDDPELRTLYAARLESRYTVRTAGSGAEALDVADPAVGIVVLDRRLPDGDGLDYLDDLDARTDGAFVAAVTGVDPELEVATVDVDDYLVKPVDGDRLVETVDALDERRHYECDVARYYALASRRAALEAAHDPESLRDDERYVSLVEELDSLRTSITVPTAIVEDPARSAALYRDIAAPE